MNATSLVALRYLFSTRERFVPFLALVDFACTTLSVFALLLVLSLMHGFQRELADRWIGLHAHLTLENWHLDQPDAKEWQDWLALQPEVTSATPVVTGEVIVQTTQGENPMAMGAKVRGVQSLPPEFLKKISFYPPLEATWEALVGEELLYNLGIFPGEDPEISLIYPLGEIGPTGDPIPRTQSFKISSAFHAGLYEWDAHTILIPMADAHYLLGEQAKQGLQIRLSDWNQWETFSKKLKSRLKLPLTLTTFADQNKRLYRALKLERWGMGVLLTLFGVIASFSIAGVLMMFVHSKSRDLAILKAIGLNNAQTRVLFFKVGGLIGGLGSAAGTGLGVLVCRLLEKYPVSLPASYYLEYLPVELRIGEVALLFCVGVGLSLVSSVYPVALAARMDPVPLLREE